MELFRSVNKLEAVALFAGDIIVFYLSLWLTLLLRHFSLPSKTLLESHLVPFSFLFGVWVVIFFIAGLYEKHTLILKSKLPAIILSAQTANILLAALFFFIIPYFGITPKTNLAIYLVVSFVLIVGWRLYAFPLVGARKRQKGILIGSGVEMKELHEEVNENTRYNLTFVSTIDLDEIEGLDFQEEIINRIYAEDIGTVVVDTQNERIEPILPSLYNLLFSRVRFIDMHKVYEDIFDRVPLSLVRYSWFLENISASRKFTYDFLKRVMDGIVALIGGIATLPLYPLIALAIKADDGGRIFIAQKRIGKNNHPITIFKFRTMTGNDIGEEVLESTLTVTRVGHLLRKSRMDEIPQFWNILKGDLSLVGPRPELPHLAKRYEADVSYYNVRHLIKPGLSGWAQLYHREHPHHGENVSATREKLSYDLYYIKNRSFLLDFKIALKTVKAFVAGK